MYIFITCMQCPWSQKTASNPMGLELQAAVSALYGSWRFNLGPLQEQPMLSTTELFL